jgi:transcriptional regulator with XRE-family HTH domain
MVMLTEFGKEIRKLRIDLGITLFEMAKATGVSSAFLSAMENGKKPVPDEYVDALAEHYEHVRNAKESFLRLADKTKKEVRINLAESNNSANELATAFARNFSELSDEQVAKIKSILNKKENA